MGLLQKDHTCAIGLLNINFHSRNIGRSSVPSTFEVHFGNRIKLGYAKLAFGLTYRS